MSSPTAGLSKTPGTPGGPEPRAIAAFVAAVRQELNDLSPDEVNELTGGLEADLTDALAEPGSAPSPVHGDPAEYASELRAAAGLPPRGTRERRDRGLGLADQVNKDFVVPVQEMIQIARRELEAKPWWPGIWDFLVVLRPAWSSRSSEPSQSGTCANRASSDRKRPISTSGWMPASRRR
jgi:hypothetical protein